MDGEFPVEQTTRKYFFDEIAPHSATNSRHGGPSCFVSLVLIVRLRRIAVLLVIEFLNSASTVRHHFERTIAGRPFVIEVTWVAEKRWRAHIVRIPGVPTAMMPFYGETPDEAATHLSDWLNRAHQHQANTV
jgi:hypothetical protein